MPKFGPKLPRRLAFLLFSLLVYFNLCFVLILFLLDLLFFSLLFFFSLETQAGRNLSTRLLNRKRSTRNGDLKKCNEHHLQTKHQIDWDSATCTTHSTDYYQRLILESWFSNLKQTPLNRSQQLLTPYKRLIDELKQNRWQ